MNHKALTISAMLTAFVLVVAGGLVFAARAASRPANVAAAPTQGLDPQTQQAIVDREAAYQAVIDQANQRIQQLQAQISQNTAPSVAPSTASTNITPQQAAQIASQALGQTQVYSVETVQWNNMTVYQVTFSSGDIARIGMDGTVLSIQQAPPQTTVTTVVSGGGSRSSHEREYEHEGGGDD